MFRTVPLSIIRSLFIVHSAIPPWSCSKAVYKPVWHIPLLRVQWINSWWWTEELSETCRVSCRSEFVKLVHLVGFIIKKWIKIVVSELHCGTRLCSSVRVYVSYTQPTNDINTLSFVCNNNGSSSCFWHQHLQQRGARENHCNIRWFYLCKLYIRMTVHLWLVNKGETN